MWWIVVYVDPTGRGLTCVTLLYYYVLTGRSYRVSRIVSLDFMIAVNKKKDPEVILSLSYVYVLFG